MSESNPTRYWSLKTNAQAPPNTLPRLKKHGKDCVRLMTGRVEEPTMGRRLENVMIDIPLAARRRFEVALTAARIDPRFTESACPEDAEEIGRLRSRIASAPTDAASVSANAPDGEPASASGDDDSGGGNNRGGGRGSGSTEMLDAERTASLGIWGTS